MRGRTLALLAAATLITVATLATLRAGPQIGRGESIVGPFYRLRLPFSADPAFRAIQVERTAPASLAPPAPVSEVALPLSIRVLVGEPYTLPERHRVYFRALDVSGVLRLLELDLDFREVRPVEPPRSLASPFGLDVLAPADGSKLYVEWRAPGALTETVIYGGAALRELDRTTAFLPDRRARDFEHRAPLLWAFDPADRLVLVDAHVDRVVRRFDWRERFGLMRGDIPDAWRDLVLVRLDAGHDRLHVVDAVSGEVGPALDLNGYPAAQPRLVLAGRYLVLVQAHRRPTGRVTGRSLPTATGAVMVYDLRDARPVRDLQLVVEPDLPVGAVGTRVDPAVPGRLWIYAPGDARRIDFDVPACDREVEATTDLRARIETLWDPNDDPRLYRYSVRVAGDGRSVGALALRAGRAAEAASAPEGWGIDRIRGESWVRWTNGLGPLTQDIAPGTAMAGFRLTAHPNARPGFVQVRLLGATGLPRNCIPDERFLEKSVAGYAVAPEPLGSADPVDLAERLQRMTDLACELRWLGASECPTLRALAAGIAGAADRTPSLDRYLDRIAGSSADPTVRRTLEDAASAARNRPGP